MSRQALTEALAYVDSRSGAANSNEVDTIIAAARLVERLLPGECENCGGTGIAGVHRHIKPSTGEHLGDQDVPCGFCFDGQVWDEGIVEAVAKAMREGPIDDLYHGQACAVLSVIAEKLGNL